jgi:TetR/AcrR family transcriptional regulator of autoinduction and epiphytic fitness
MLFDKGKGPYLERLEEYLAAETRAGSLSVKDNSTAARQFLAIIAGQAFWPELVVPGCGGTQGQVTEIVADAVALMLARYRCSD